MILIVDDKQENLFSLKALLLSHGYEADTADSGELALKKILKHQYSLIILDVQMPEMDGYEVAENITGFSKSRHIPIIFLSAVNIDKRFVTKGYASGGVDYITKPFDPDILLMKVETFRRLSNQTNTLLVLQEQLEKEIAKRKAAQQALEEANALLEERVKARTAELAHANKELEKSNIELQQFASVASHDLQEPLRKIITYTELVKDKIAQQVPEAAGNFQKVLAASTRMKNLIIDLLNYSKLSSTSPFENTSLNEVLEETLSDLEFAINEKNAVVTHTLLPRVEVIPGQMRQVFQNIISNALKFTNKEACPTIHISSELVVANPANGDGEMEECVRIHIKDNGIGFNPQYVNKIFTIFQRLHPRNEYDGTGIGLAIVKKIIENHRGSIVADSREGEGSTFSILLPLKHHLVNETAQS